MVYDFSDQKKSVYARQRSAIRDRVVDKSVHYLVLFDGARTGLMVEQSLYHGRYASAGEYRHNLHRTARPRVPRWPVLTLACLLLCQ